MNIDSTMGRIHVCFLYCLLVTIRELVGSFTSLRMSTGSGLRLGGTISHRPLNPDLSGDFERFRISNPHTKASGQGIKKSSNKPKKTSKKASSKKKKANFKSLKFNF